MNLWVRTLGQLTLLSVALFFFSCEDESNRLGFKNPKQKFNVRYVDIPLNASQVMMVDSLITDLRPVVTQTGQSLVDGLLVGQYQDPTFGKITAQSYLTVYPTSNLALNSTSVFDSITVEFRLNFYGYGFSERREFRIPVHEITGDTLSLYGGNRYYANSTPPTHSVDPLGEAVITVHYDSLLKGAALRSNEQDTLLAVGRLNEAYGLKVFNAIKDGFSNADAHKLFREQIKGIALLPPTEAGILGINVINDIGQLSRVRIHYHTLTDEGAVDDTLSATLGFEYASFTRIDADRTATEIPALLPYEAGQPLSGNMYIQSGAPLVTKLDLAPFYAFADTVENIIVNSAELVVSGVEEPLGMEPHSALMLRLLQNNTNLFLNTRVATDRQIASNYFVNAADNYFFAASEGSSPALIRYDSQSGRYSGFLTMFVQTLFGSKGNANGVNNDRLQAVALVPYTPSPNRAVTRTLFHKDNISLRIFYTQALTVTP